MPFKFKIQNTAAQRKKSSEYTQTHTHTQALTPAHEHTNDLKGSNSGNTVHATLMQFMFITSICVCMCRWLQRAANGINSVNSCQWQAESLKRCLYAQNAARACEYFCAVLWRHTYSYMHIHRILYTYTVFAFCLFAYALIFI